MTLFGLALAALSLSFAATLSTFAWHNEVGSVSAVLQTYQRNQQTIKRQLEVLKTQQGAVGARVAAMEAEFTEQPNIAATAKRASRSVFTIESGNGSGSGFVVEASSRRSLMVTNFHVVADTYVNGGNTVDVVRGDLTYTGRISDVSESDDLALIAVSAQLPSLAIAPKQPAIGDPLLVLGSPLGLGGTVTSGIVSAYRDQDGLRYLQFSAPISPGNSGGPVINEHGKVVGVAVAKMVGGGAEGLGFAIPTSRLCSALDIC